MEQNQDIIFVVIIIAISLASILFFKIILGSHSEYENEVNEDVQQIDGLTYENNEENQQILIVLYIKKVENTLLFCLFLL